MTICQFLSIHTVFLVFENRNISGQIPMGKYTQNIQSLSNGENM